MTSREGFPVTPRVLSVSAVTTFAMACAVTSVMTLGACSGITDAKDPSNLVTADAANTQQGAVSLYQGALTQFSEAYGASSDDGSPSASYFSYTFANGLFSDEMRAASARSDYDSRITTDQTEVGGNGPYANLHKTRVTIARALVSLAQYSTVLPPSYRGELHALEGYIRVMFAELYCSGVPFSYLDDAGNVVYGKPESSTQMYQDAIAQFDSAAAIATDSVRIQQLAAIGKARALLDLGEYDSAATAAAGIPVTFVSNVKFSTAHLVENAWYSISLSSAPGTSVADRKGGTGLNFASASDPRLPLQSKGSSLNYETFSIVSNTLPVAFAHVADLPIPLATGIEGQLVAVEAALKRGDPSWLTMLNALRTSCPTSAGCATPAPAGTGGVAGLPPLDDPMTDTGRVSLVFRERAFWMYGTGHRTGDLRRLIRQYGRNENAVFPMGTNGFTYPTISFGTQMTIEPPQTERNNPNYHGCLSRDA